MQLKIALPGAAIPGVPDEPIIVVNRVYMIVLLTTRIFLTFRFGLSVLSLQKKPV